MVRVAARRLVIPAGNDAAECTCMYVRRQSTNVMRRHVVVDFSTRGWCVWVICSLCGLFGCAYLFLLRSWLTCPASGCLFALDAVGHGVWRVLLAYYEREVAR